ncbi:hypothetical protein BKG82_12730 [Mycobacteroides chelonae]|uniref:Uncharacterized protein n=1 Tax=Mycobacteroides chelonae TaxID=1774 RepID=A0A1S1LKS4_MYCCH|nr:hypothetical protein [Mycobacteroides chelonae]OHU57052.1 hypothetical protein BKG82_12730 [Mycobacteroides chelonae]
MLLTDLAEVTPDDLDRLGISTPPALAGATIAMWRTSDKAKWHWVDERSRCKHLPDGRYGPRRRPVVPQQIPVLGFDLSRTALCSQCADRIALTAPAEAFITIAAALLRSARWLEQGRAGAAAGSWSWLAFARWKANRPLTGQAWDDALRQVRGKNWAGAALTLRGLVADFRAEADAVTRACVDSIAENPARASQIERAIRMVETDSPAREESDRVLVISGCRVRADDPWAHSQPYSQSSPWEVVASAWRQSGPAARGHQVLLEALCGYLDDQFPHVHDLAALAGCLVQSPAYEPGECLQSWAWRSAQAHRRAVVSAWLSRLDLALDGIASANRDPAVDCTHLVAVPFWPPVHDGLESVAYLSQFDVVAGPFKQRSEYFAKPSVAVLRVPEWAAQHAEQLRRPMRTVAIDDEAVQAIQLARAEGIAVMAGEFGRPRKPSQRVQESRAEMGADVHPYPEYRYMRRPLAPGAAPPNQLGAHGGGVEWTYWRVQQALGRGAVFVYGTDDLELLSLACTKGRWRPQVTLAVELQTGCRRHRDQGPHVCEVDGHLSTVNPDGALGFTPDELEDPVPIPAAYIAGLTFR